MNYQLIVIVNFILCYSIMKFMSYKLSPSAIPLRTFVLSPYLSARSFKLKDKSNHDHLVSDFFTFTLFLFFTIILAREVSLPIFVLAPIIYFLTEIMGCIGQLLFLHYHDQSYSINRAPYRSVTVSEFWGRRWNLWVQDWLKDMSFTFRSIPRTQRILLIFFISGLFHEAMVNLPYYLVFGKSYFGTMLAYFFIQALALWFEKRFLRGYSQTIHRIYLWAAVILPSPLFINVPLLTFFGIPV